ncbi:transcription factor WhiB [Mycobacterium sp. CBMA293]|uniref:WhiB family transcriptional regulator n=1 Tax=unclassified Mycolicibacterium TaxID=2636767 RepID=UPI0012DD79AD|nr:MULTISPECIES: WhiB family transcriptional regulator [unclassified Mycolicibacterium]MUL49978.1 transcription factor WhiB [Mycolicibacterium sp. CBMA 360]MUL61575.1 transcription factor WhiB [Mycolicibacterium sp. CBMA 335]MUL74310.1 transcription factor WhiB [Mycolicibacterium sp. CBMA 311]MUL96588.1 transcription factor WhiB [Mycolicibacterium sp. CBMA 230]MUM04254.1 hypothetical protein [Mycolicibacterium sp. CBMA 213]
MTVALQISPIPLPPCTFDPDRWATAGNDAEVKALCRRCPRRQRCASEAVTTPGLSGVVAGVHIPEGRRSRASAMAQLRAVAAVAGLAGQPQIY